MGGSKATIELASRPLVARVVGTVGSAGLDPVVVAKPDTPLPRLDCRVLTEPAEPRHPLTGIVAALDASAGRSVVAIACDMPLVPGKLLSWLAGQEGRIAVCEVGGRLEPLVGLYSPEVRDALMASLERREPVREAVAALDPVVLDEERVRRFGDPGRIFFNLNTPADLAAAERMLASSGRLTKAFRKRSGSPEPPATAAG